MTNFLLGWVCGVATVLTVLLVVFAWVTREHDPPD